MKRLIFLILLILNFLIVPQTFAVVDPRNVENNKFGIHILSSTPEELDSARELVNSNGGDWGYVTLLIEEKDRNTQKWQEIFNKLNEKHLIPLVRLTTSAEGSYWKRLDGEDAKEWS